MGTREYCPVCGEYGRGDWQLRFVVPDGWELPTVNRVLECDECGFIWYDNDKTQADYDKYYINRYGFDGALNKGDSFARQEELVQIAAGLGLPKTANIVDFGGGKERYIEGRLKELGYDWAVTVDAGDKLPDNIDLLIASQVLEHVYDIPGVMGKLAMAVDGAILVELPDAERMTTAQGQMLLDYHQKHVNHFRPTTLDRLFSDYGFSPTYQERKLEGWHFGYVYRVIYRRPFDAYECSKRLVENATAKHVKNLQSITEPVVVWGCSDVCLYLLDKVKLNVVHYVDIDPAYRGATIGGVPVLDHVESDAPIVVMAYNQRSAILKDIQERGYKNEVIVI